MSHVYYIDIGIERERKREISKYTYAPQQAMYTRMNIHKYKRNYTYVNTHTHTHTLTHAHP